jgi:hypothetical protein
MSSLRGERLVFLFFLLFTFAFLLPLQALAQPPEGPKDAEPPPLKLLSKSEKMQLDAVTEVKERTMLAITLMDARIKAAENFNGQEAYPEMFTELGGFHALVDNTLYFLNRNDDGKRKILMNFKKFEISLRSYLARLENIRRELPLKYEFYVRGLIKNIRDARTKAVEPLFDDTVVPTKNTN